MNNKFSRYVTRSIIITWSKVIGLFLAPIIAILLSLITKNPIFFLAYFILMFILIGFSTKKKEKQTNKYKLGKYPDNNIYVPLVLVNDYLKNVSSEFNNPVELPDNINSLVSYVQYMIDNNQMIFVTDKFKLDDIVNLLNNLMKHQNIDYSINKKDIIKNDDEIIKLRRKDNIETDFYDLAAIRSILESNQLKLITFYADDEFSKATIVHGYILAIVPSDRLTQIRKHWAALFKDVRHK